MIAKPQWFKRRKYFGWGAYPATWQGWLYLAVALVLIAIIQFIPITSQLKIVLTILIALILIVDTAIIMPKLSKDERDKKHEAIAERNALWAILSVLVSGVSYQVASSAVRNDFSNVDWFLVAAIIFGLLVKAMSNLYLDRKD
ncbi:Uncharacterised protein [uncultured archaeon]|nr:Uncharacterised protein [uncultured archaeon]